MALLLRRSAVFALLMVALTCQQVYGADGTASRKLLRVATTLETGSVQDPTFLQRPVAYPVGSTGKVWVGGFRFHLKTKDIPGAGFTGDTSFFIDIMRNGIPTGYYMPVSHGGYHVGTSLTDGSMYMMIADGAFHLLADRTPLLPPGELRLPMPHPNDVQEQRSIEFSDNLHGHLSFRLRMGGPAEVYMMEKLLVYVKFVTFTPPAGCTGLFCHLGATWVKDSGWTYLKAWEDVTMEYPGSGEATERVLTY